MIDKFIFLFFIVYLQNIEPAVTIDTVPNVKKKHDIHVGMYEAMKTDKISTL